MRTRILIAALAAATLGLPGVPALAARCPQLADPPGDSAGGDAALDIVAAGVGSDMRDLTVTIELDRLGPATPTPAATSPAGVNYSVELTLAETRLEFIASYAAARAPVYRVRRTSGGDLGALGWFTVAGPEVSSRVRGVVDDARDEVRVTVPVADLAAFGATRRGATVHGLRVYAWRTVPLVVDTVIASADVAEGHVTYRLGSPSCTPVGR